VVERDVNGRPFTVGFELDAKATARVRRVFELAAEGRSTREIGEELGMHPTQVRRVLASTEYRGDKGFPRIIAPELWAKARRRMREARPRRRS
jgi:DNA invertase Pin-like site-specific DNA recombinase